MESGIQGVESRSQDCLGFPYDLTHTVMAKIVPLSLMNMSEYFNLPDFNPDLLEYGYGKKLQSATKLLRHCT